MSMLEEMVETFLSESIVDSHGNVDPKLGLRAVLEKHVQPMLAKAHAQGSDPKARYRSPADQVPVFQGDVNYAARVIAELTGVTQSQPE